MSAPGWYVRWHTMDGRERHSGAPYPLPRAYTLARIVGGAKRKPLVYFSTTGPRG